MTVEALTDEPDTDEAKRVFKELAAAAAAPWAFLLSRLEERRTGLNGCRF